MKITLFPFITDDTVEASVSGDTLTINGEAIDLSVIPDGYKLPASAIDCKWFSVSDYVERIDGEFNFTLLMPCSWESPDEFRNPKGPIILNVKRGKVEFPDTRTVENDKS